MADRFEKFTERARKVLQLANEEAQRFHHNYIGTEHLLLGLIREESGVAARVLQRLGVDVERVRDAVDYIIGRGDMLRFGDIGLTPRAKKVLELAVDEARRMSHSYIGTEHLLLGLVREGGGVAASIMESLGVRLDDVRAAVHDVLQSSAMHGVEQWWTLTRWTTPVHPGPAVARDREIERLIEVLLRRTRHNPILVGGPGSGRMSVVRGLSERMSLAEVPVPLPVRRIVVLDTERLESADGAFVATLSQVALEAAAANVLLCVPELQRLTPEAIALLISSMAHNRLRMLGITTPAAYERMAAEHPSLAEQSQPVLVEEATVQQTVAVLSSNAAALQQHHSVSIFEPAIAYAAEFARRFLVDRLLPRSAMDLLDEAAGVAHAHGAHMVTEDDVREALARWASALDVEPEAGNIHERLLADFSPNVVDALMQAFGDFGTISNQALLVFIPRGARTRRFVQAAATAMFGSPTALVQVDLARSTGQLATYPPGRVWFADDPQVAERLRQRPRCMLWLNAAERATPSGLDLAECILRQRQLTDRLGRRLDLSQAAIVVTAARGAQVDQGLRSLVSGTLAL